MKKIGLFIGRMNPPHKGHIGVIQKALLENDEVLLLLGDSGIIDESNPLSFEQRKFLLQKFFYENKNLKINIIKDTKTDKQWVENISENIKNYFGEDIFLNIYGGDFKNDSAIIAMKQFENILGEKIHYISVNRFLETLEYSGGKFHISATNLRNALRNGNREFVEKFCNEELVVEIIKLFKSSYY